jgi:hypothetical protein
VDSAGVVLYLPDSDQAKLQVLFPTLGPEVAEGQISWHKKRFIFYEIL